jgi:hypothetical protein
MPFDSTHSKLHDCHELGVRVGETVRSSDCWCVEACGDIEIDGYASDPVGPGSLVLDLCITLNIIITLLTLSPICLL